MCAAIDDRAASRAGSSCARGRLATPLSGVGGIRMLRRVVLLGAVTLAAYPAAGQLSAGAASSAVTGVQPVLPADLVMLEQKMGQLQVRSERFSTLSRGAIKITNQSN